LRWCKLRDRDKKATPGAKARFVSRVRPKAKALGLPGCKANGNGSNNGKWWLGKSGGKEADFSTLMLKVRP